jgi:Fe-S-cluster containining protein
VKQLFEDNIIGFMPFFDTETNDAYDVEIGLVKPCRLHTAKRCSAYPARPLNCRIFPFFLIARFPKEALSKIFNPSYDCIHGIDLSEKEKEKYKNYSKKIGDMLLLEAENTEKMMKEIGFNLRFSIIDYRDELKKKFEGRKVNDEEAEEIRINFFLNEIKRKDLEPYIQKISLWEEKHRFVSIKELDEIEKILG